MSAPHLLLDYDKPENVPGAAWLEVAGAPHANDPDAGRAHEVMAARLARAGYTVESFTLERSTNGWHGTVTLDRTPSGPMEVVALQAICGSDPSRESCNVERARQVQDMGAHAARVLLAEIERGREGASDRRAAEGATAVARGWLTGRAAASDSFWLDRWNVLYQPNPHRRETK